MRGTLKSRLGARTGGAGSFRVVRNRGHKDKYTLSWVWCGVVCARGGGAVFGSGASAATTAEVNREGMGVRGKVSWYKKVSERKDS